MNYSLRKKNDVTVSRTGNVARNAISVTLNRIVGLLIPFVLRTVVIKILGEHYLGLSNLFSSVLQVLSLADLGFGTAIVYSMYEPIAQNDSEKICALLAVYKKIYFTIGCIVLTVGVAVIPFLDYVIKGDCPKDINITWVYLIYLANTVLDYLLFADRKALMSAHQKSYIVNNINSMTQILIDVIKLTLLFILKDYYLYIIFLPIMTFICDLLCAKYSYKLYPQYRAKGRLDSASNRAIIKRVKALTVQKFGDALSTSVDNIVVSSFLGLKQVAIYGNYFYIVTSLYSFIGGVISSATASIGNSLAIENVEKNYTVFKRINMINQWALVWCVPCLMCLYQHFMKMWVGNTLMSDGILVSLMGGYFYLVVTRKVVQVFKDAAGMWWDDKWKPFVGGMINLILNIVTVQIMGMHGVILSTIISYLFIEIPWETCVLFKKYFKGYLIDYLIDIIKYFVTICCTLVVSVICCCYVVQSGIIGFIIKGVICFTISNFVFVLFFHRRDEFKELLGIIVKKMKL